MGEAEALEARRARRRSTNRSRARRPRTRGSRPPSGRPSGRRRGRDNAPVRRCSTSLAPPSSAKAPAASGRKPAMARKTVDLPAPFGPVSRSASPARASKERPAMNRAPAAFDGDVPGAQAHGFPFDGAHPFERLQTIVCVARRWEFIYKPAHPFPSPHYFGVSSPWPVLTASNVARRSRSGPRPINIFRSRRPKSTALPASRNCPSR